ncbi:MAG: putative Ig domain-containing protein [Gammaproteobacteria bacterium]|nr:putative Ig domain-containing protein [Gammaproteobacteria bacterium]
MRAAPRLAAGACALVALAGCGGGGGGSGPPPEPPRAAEISVSPASATLSYIDESTTFTASVLDQNGRAFTGAVTWSSSDESIFTVNSSGEVTAVRNGSGTLTASIANLSAEASVTVEQAASGIEIVSGAGQEAEFDSMLPQAIVIRVLDEGGTAVGDITVNFEVETGQGAADPESAQTDGEGTASTNWTLGDAIGTQILTVTAGEDAELEVAAEATPLRPRLATPRLPDAYADIAYSAMLRAESGSGSGYSWAVAGGDLPAGLALAASGEISGAASRADSYEFDVRITDGAGTSQVSTVRLRVCEGPLHLESGEFRRFAPTSDADCGFALRATEAGEYYRVTLVAASRVNYPTESVALDITSPGTGETSIFEQFGSVMFAGDGIAALTPGPMAVGRDPHVERLADERRGLSELAARGELRPLRDLRYERAALAPPPETRDFTRGGPGTLEDNCRLEETRTGELVAFNDHVALYAEPDVTPALNRDNVNAVADHYRDYGARVIDEYFGGVGDVDGDGRITVFLDSELHRNLAGVVWLGDFLSKDDCAASNEAELMRLNRSWFGPAYFSIAGTLVHEAQHVSSLYQWLLKYADDPPLDVFSKSGQPPWIEEGKSEIAKEMASRLAWEALGGPGVHRRVTRSDLLAQDMRSVDLHGILYVLAGTKQALSSDLYALWRYPYGAGWHFLRFLGDWRGNPAGVPLGDAGLFRELTDSATPVSFEGLERATGASWEDLMTEYAVAASLAGTSAPAIEGVPGFRTYDFTGLNIERHFFERPGRYPWPSTTSGDGNDAVLWVSLGVSRRLEGQLAQNGLRIHDFRADAAGDTAVFRVEAPAHARAIVLRLPDQAQSSLD